MYLLNRVQYATITPTMTKDIRKALTVNKVSEQTGFSRGKVVRFIESNELPAIDISSGTVRSHWVVYPEDLDRFIASRKNG